MNMDAAELLSVAIEALQIEAQAIEALTATLDGAFIEAVECMLNCQGKVVVSGMGKSGHIGNKISATFASTGTPSFFMHPAEASHGDLGMIESHDVLLMLSNSGESGELLAILPFLRRRGIFTIAMTGDPTSTMARESDIHLNVAVAKEACPLGLAPTSSTTAALALGDALAVALLTARGFREEDFALTHPGGALGRRLLVHVRDLMRTGERLPVVLPDVALKDVLLVMTRTGMGMAAVADVDHRVMGIFTDGDLRRALDRGVDIHKTPVVEVMTLHPSTIAPDHLAAEAAQIMEKSKVYVLLVVDEGDRLVGALNMHDLLRAKVV